uniref:EGF-like domain-containing protein n=1 Tax=Romanomermis culicivorax TaxID=13658 RepID=A0A915I130_ROMCU
MNECLNATVICPKNSDCYDTPGSYRCVCNRGFRNAAPPTAPRPFCQAFEFEFFAITFVFSFFKVEFSTLKFEIAAYKFEFSLFKFEFKHINECLNIFSYTCGMYQHCVNDEGSYHCECNYGYYATQINPLVCQDIDECNNATVRMCSSDAKCTNTPGSFYCTCNVGFYGDGKFCKNIDECNMNLHNCNTFGIKMKMICIDKVPGFLCQCPTGFRWNPSSRDCEDIDECVIPYMNNCTMFHAKCRNTYGSFACDCLRGFMRDPTCPAVLCPCVNINECQNYTACAPNAVCQDMTPGYLCTCNMGYVGDGYRECRGMMPGNHSAYIHFK